MLHMVYVDIIWSLSLETLEVLFLTTGSRHSWTPTHQLLQQVPVCLFLLVMITTLLCSSPPFRVSEEGSPIPSSRRRLWWDPSLLISTLTPCHDSNWWNAGAELLRDLEVWFPGSLQSCCPVLFLLNYVVSEDTVWRWSRDLQSTKMEGTWALGNSTEPIKPSLPALLPPSHYVIIRLLIVSAVSSWVFCSRKHLHWHTPSYKQEHIEA